MMIDTAQHDDTDAILALQLVERLARLSADFGFAFVESMEGDCNSPVIFFAAETEYWPPCLEHLIGADLPILKVQNWIHI